MESKQSILFPFYENDSALDKAINVAIASDAKLYILHTYRFGEKVAMIQKKGNNSLKRSVDESLGEQLRSKYEKKLAGSGVDFEIKVEIGFLTDRIVHNFRTHDVRTVLIDDSKGKDEEVIHKLYDLNIPVTLLSSVNSNSRVIS